MARRWEIPEVLEFQLRRKFKGCAYCGRRMKAHPNVVGVPRDKATIEHLNRHGPFYWSDGLEERHLVIACAGCNASRGRKRLVEWFASSYCLHRGITRATVAARVRTYLRTALAKR
jgi:hypothetical protein